MCYSSEDYDTRTLDFDDSRRARKRHRCSSCRMTIDAGQRYLFCSFVFEGSIHSEKVCHACCRLADAIVEIELSEGCHRSESRPPLGWEFEEACVHGLVCRTRTRDGHRVRDGVILHKPTKRDRLAKAEGRA